MSLYCWPAFKVRYALLADVSVVRPLSVLYSYLENGSSYAYGYY